MKGLSRIYLALCAWAVIGCGPAFTVAPDDVGAGDAGGLIRLATTLDAGMPFVFGDASDAGEKDPADAAADVVDERQVDVRIPVDAGELLEVGVPVDARELVDAGDASEDAHGVMLIEAGPRPLCCATPCSGAQVGDIACASSLPWTCGAGSCETAGACTAGATCHWMGTSCTGTVEVCP